MDASEMARRRWLNVPAEERSRITRAAAQARWSSATKQDLEMARIRARAARNARTRKLIAQTLGVDVSKLSNVKAELVTASKFRKQKSREQNEHWTALREQRPHTAVHIQPERARRAVLAYPATFSLNPERKDE
jgi:hypothetical protein